ncbi:MAG: histidine kinase [Proteobacteria bacterium]|nr:histidine kinase [Pseudomonadota bacterium]
MSLEIIAAIIAKTTNCKIEDVKPESKLTELGLSSLDTITMLFELEEAFDIEIPNEVISSIVTVNDILGKLNDLDRSA